ncbi:MAG: DUF2868 domain-containing protein [Planctomycetia bacterium]|nr:DUF2868 domain-containing protein [Planctomycetia bacterium]
MVEQNKNMGSDPIREKSSVFGSLMVQCLRLLEKDRKEPGKKAEYSIDADKDASGRLLRPYEFLVHRAEQVLPQYNISGRTIRNTVKGIFFTGLGLILLFGMFLLPLAKAINMLGTDEVNLAGPFFWFVALQLFFLCLSFFFLILSGIQSLFLFLFFRNRTGSNRQASWLDRCSSLAGSGIIGLIRFFYRDRETSSGGKDDRQKIIPSFVDYLVHKREPIFCLSGLYSHFFWLILSFFLLICLMIQMQGNEYRYRWKTSLSSIDETRQLTGILSKPFPHFAKPTEDDIQSLFEKKAGTEKGEGAHQSQIRRHWSWFVLFSVLFYSVFPRGFLALIYYGLFRRSLKEFDPDLDDPYFKKIIEEEEQNDSDIRSEKIIEESDHLPSPLDLPKMEEKEFLIPVEQTVPARKPADSADAPNSVNVPELSVALGYDADMDREIWDQILGKKAKKEIFGNIVVNREMKRNFLDQFHEIGQRIRTCLLLTDSSFPPARQFLLFLEELIQNAPQAEFFIILSCGERLRQKFHGDPDSIQQRISDWEERIRKIRHQLNVRVETITCFDHELNLPGPREQIAAIIQQRTVRSSGNELDKMDQAFLSIRKECEKVFERSKSDDLSKEENEDYERELRLYQTIRNIYSAESESFLNRCRDYISEKTSMDPGMINRLQSQIPEITDLEELKTKILPSAEMIEKVKGFCSKLSPRCAIAVGLTGAALPLAAAAAPLIGGTITLASVAGLVGSLGTILPASLAAGGTGALIGSMIPASFSSVKDRIKKELTGFFSGQIAEEDQKTDSTGRVPMVNSLVCTGAVWTLIFELQGRSEEIIADLLPKILAPIDESLLDTMEEINRVLDQIRVNRENLDRIESGK